MTTPDWLPCTRCRTPQDCKSTGCADNAPRLAATLEGFLANHTEGRFELRAPDGDFQYVSAAQVALFAAALAARPAGAPTPQAAEPATTFGPGPWHVEARTNACADVVNAIGRTVATCSWTTEATGNAQAICGLLNAMGAASSRAQQGAPVAMPCGHHPWLMLMSAETGLPLYCELCDAQSGRRDAETRETELQAEVSSLRAYIAWLQGCLRDEGHCIDGGKCHHDCERLGDCWRQRSGCVPLTGSGLNDDWSLAGQQAGRDARSDDAVGAPPVEPSREPLGVSASPTACSVAPLPEPQGVSALWVPPADAETPT